MADISKLSPQDLQQKWHSRSEMQTGANAPAVEPTWVANESREVGRRWEPQDIRFSNPDRHRRHHGYRNILGSTIHTSLAEGTCGCHVLNARIYHGSFWQGGKYLDWRILLGDDGNLGTLYAPAQLASPCWRTPVASWGSAAAQTVINFNAGHGIIAGDILRIVGATGLPTLQCHVISVSTNAVTTDLDTTGLTVSGGVAEVTTMARKVVGTADGVHNILVMRTMPMSARYWALSINASQADIPFTVYVEGEY